MITRTHNGYHLGDNLIHLHFLRKVALANPNRQFVHAAQWQYLREMQDIIADVPNVKLEEFGYMTPATSINAWRGDNGCWYNNPDRNDFVKFHVETWFPYLAERMSVANPITNREEMLFDYPALRTEPKQPTGCDVLVVNSPPGSGQATGFDQYEMATLAARIATNEQSVVVTDDYPKNLVSAKRFGYSVTEIGYLSLYCHTILMVSTGPSWPTFNVWNQETVKNRIILLDSERVWLSPHTIHCSKVEEAAEVLKEIGLL